MVTRTKDVDMVLVMGVSGAGKSYFINCLTGAIAGSEDEAVVGPSLMSCTSKCQVIHTHIGNTDFVIVDCPGFDDTLRSDAEILHEITETLSALYIVGLRLKGVIYLQRITDNKMQGSSMKNLQLFIKMIGKESLSNVIFTTTMWGKVQAVDFQEANTRDAELRDEYWADYINQGATATRFKGTKASAEGILSVLLGKKDVVLRVQDELVNGGMKLRETEVGEYLEPTVEEEQAEFEAKVDELGMKIRIEKDGGRRLDYQRRQRKAQAGKQQRQNDKKTLQSKPGQDARKKLKDQSVEFWKNALQALAAVVSVGAAVTGIVLSAAGG